MTVKMNAGMLDQRLQLYIVARVADGKGGWTDNETLVGDVWCKVAEKSTQRLTDEGKLLMSRYYEVSTRHRADLVSGRRLTFGAQKLTIESVEQLEPTRQWIKMKCNEVTT